MKHTILLSVALLALVVDSSLVPISYLQTGISFSGEDLVASAAHGKSILAVVNSESGIKIQSLHLTGEISYGYSLTAKGASKLAATGVAPPSETSDTTFVGLEYSGPMADISPSCKLLEAYHGIFVAQISDKQCEKVHLITNGLDECEGTNAVIGSSRRTDYFVATSVNGIKCPGFTSDQRGIRISRVHTTDTSVRMFHLLIAKSSKLQNVPVQTVHVEHISEFVIKAYVAINLANVDVKSLAILTPTGQYGAVPEGATAIIVVIQTRDDGDIGVVGIRPFRAENPLTKIRHMVAGYTADSPIVIGTSDKPCKDCTLVAGQLVPVWAGTAVFAGTPATIAAAEGSAILEVHNAHKSRGRVFVAFTFSGPRVSLPSGHHIDSGCTAPENKQEYAVVRLQQTNKNELQFEDFTCLPKRSSDDSSVLRDTQILEGGPAYIFPISTTTVALASLVRVSTAGGSTVALLGRTSSFKSNDDTPSLGSAPSAQMTPAHMQMEQGSTTSAWLFTIIIFSIQGALGYAAWKYWLKTTSTDESAASLTAALQPVKEFNDFSDT